MKRTLLTVTALAVLATVSAQERIPTDTTLLAQTADSLEAVTCQRPYRAWVALKTNLLADALLCPNLELEVPLGSRSRWSVMAEFWSPWYVWHHNSRAYEFQAAGAEVRYWWPPKTCRPCHRLMGTFLGIYLASGQYDLEWSSKGYQGEFVSAGLTIGRSWRLSTAFRLEASLSVGAAWGPYDRYSGEKYNDRHLIWQYKDDLFYIGPTKAKLSIAWLLPGGRRHPKQEGGAR